MDLVLHPALNAPAQPVCSICIANYNGETILSDCLDSIFAQSGGHAIEVLVHDDASTDGSLTLLHQRYPQVKVLESTRNVGFCISNNRMADHARGEFILLLNNDAALLPDALSTLLDHARSHPPSILSLPQYDWETGDLVDRGCLLDPFYNPVPNLDLERTEVAMVIGACLWIPRQLWKDLGGFPEWFESIAEDMYLCCLARLRGFKVEALPASGYRHRQGSSFGGNRATGGGLVTTYRRRRLSERNKTFTMFVCTPSPAQWLLIPAHLCALAIEGIILSFLKGEPAVWRHIYGNVYLSLITAYRNLRSHRLTTQSNRRISLISYVSVFRWIPHKFIMLANHGLPRIH